MIGVSNPYQFHRLSVEIAERFSRGIFAARQKPIPDFRDDWPMIPEPYYPKWPSNMQEQAFLVSDRLARQPDRVCRVFFRGPISASIGRDITLQADKQVTFTYFGLGKHGATRLFAPQFATQADEDLFLAILAERPR